MIIRPATPDDLKTILALLAECAEWIVDEVGIKQWPLSWPERWLRQAIESGEQFVAVIGGEVVATLRLQDADPQTWDDPDCVALYVHQLAVRRDLKGQRIGEQLLDWAQQRVVEAKRTYLRLDCLASNIKLCEYYIGLRFEHCGDVEQGTLWRKWTSSLLQRQVQ